MTTSQKQTPIELCGYSITELDRTYPATLWDPDQQVYYTPGRTLYIKDREGRSVLLKDADIVVLKRYLNSQY